MTMFASWIGSARRIKAGFLAFAAIAWIGSSPALAANFVYVRIARKWGHQRSVVVLCATGMLMVAVPLLLTVLATPLALPPLALTASFALVFVLSGVRDSGIGVAANSFLLDLAPPGQGPLYVGITHSALGLVLVLAAGSGLVVSAFGFLALFAVAALAQALAVWDALQLGHARPLEPSASG